MIAFYFGLQLDDAENDAIKYVPCIYTFIFDFGMTNDENVR